MVRLVRSGLRSLSTTDALTAALIAVNNGKMMVGNTACLGALDIELEPTEGEGRVKVRVAVPCVPSKESLYNFNIVKNCNAAQILWGTSTYRQAVEFGTSVLAEANKHMREALGSPAEPIFQELLEELAFSLFSRCGRFSRRMAKEALSPMDARKPESIWFREDGSVAAKAVGWVGDVWSDSLAVQYPLHHQSLEQRMLPWIVRGVDLLTLATMRWG
ncbi:hypothetical protein GNI_056140 [Gregarina niphandrodes]|uniref:Uncharacterized protein n=1 Tax=Gregarina niphandrodes TaxID=110365 RepID=A0A023B8T7_GRENI|nr:hypothetical protein GNI_056140 [Gregarina niphandrodes]EZG70291.1 hypothetical protein GNI_056140 [Gregarina niphandrodes]|eukprot:XP_011129953.1 hypothetical protein GNI_056140 [Gregarina niphandrodes]